jgi:hypothetical protein
MIPHRYLFDCYVYQYHLLQFAIILVSMVCALDLTLILYLTALLVHRDRSSGESEKGAQPLDTCKTHTQAFLLEPLGGI